MTTDIEKILLFDIETKPILAYCWGLFDQNISLEMIKEDWQVLSFAAKWLGQKDVIYMDVSKDKDDVKVLKGMWKLLNEASVVITQNGRKFDAKKLNARFVINDINPPSSYKHFDTLQVAKKHFAFTSHKLRYMSEALCPEQSKLKHEEFPGFELWKECMAGNPKAWAVMKKYNIRDVIALEGVYNKIKRWDTSINFNLYRDSPDNICSCGSDKFHKNGYAYTSVGRYQRYSCAECGAETRGKTNLLSEEKKKSLRTGVVR